MMQIEKLKKNIRESVTVSNELKIPSHIYIIQRLALWVYFEVESHVTSYKIGTNLRQIGNIPACPGPIGPICSQKASPWVEANQLSIF